MKAVNVIFVDEPVPHKVIVYYVAQLNSGYDKRWLPSS